MKADAQLKAYAKVQDWFLDYLVEREKAWERKFKAFLKEGMSPVDLQTERLCFNADTFHRGWTKFEEVGAESDFVDDFYDLDENRHS